MRKLRKRRIGVYGDKTRRLQSRLTAELFSLTFKTANIFKYLGSRDSVDPDINDIQNQILFETPDRAYDVEPFSIMIGMEPMGETGLDFSRFGIINPIGDEETFRVHVDEFECLGRTIIVGDVLEIPFFMRDCKPVFWEVTDVDDKPSYENFYYTIKATIISDSRLTREIPIERSNEDIMNGVIDGLDLAFDQQISQVGLDPEPIEDGGDKPPVDYRNKQQASFLDDPSYIFNEE